MTLHIRTTSGGSTLNPEFGGSSDGRHCKRGKENSRDCPKKVALSRVGKVDSGLPADLPAKDRSLSKTG